MHWTRRVGLLCLGLFTLSLAKVGWGQDNLAVNNSGVVHLDDFSGSAFLSNDGSNYLLFQKIVGDGAGFSHGFSRLGWRARLWEEMDQQLFGEIHAMVTDDSRVGFNIGGGYRWGTTSGGIMGVHGWFDDYETVSDKRYRQVTGGVEFLHPMFDIRANGYVPINTNENFLGVFDPGTDVSFLGNNLVTAGLGGFERAYHGWDFEAGGPVPLAQNWLRWYGGVYQMLHDHEKIFGFRTRAEARFMEGVNLNLVLSEDNKFGTNLNLGVEVRFSGTMPTRFQSGLLADRRYDQVRRTWPIQTRVAQEHMPVPLNNPETGDPIQITFVNNTNPGGGSGTFEDPFTQLPGNAPGSDLVLVYRGNGNTVGNITLEDNQRLLGEGIAHFVDTDRLGVIQLPTHQFNQTSGLAPTLAALNPANPIVTLANGNEVASFRFAGGNAIQGNGVEDFLIHHIHGNLVNNGIIIENASGTGILHDINMINNPGAIGVGVTSAAGTTLDLLAENISVTGGSIGLGLMANGGDINFAIDGLTVTNTTDAGLVLMANSADLTGTIDNTSTNNNIGTGVFIQVGDSTGSLVFNELQSSNNGVDGVQIIAFAGSDYSVDILDSTINGNIDDNVEAIVMDAGTVLNLFIDPTAMDNAGDNAFEFLVQDGATLNAELLDVTLVNAGNNAIEGTVLNGGIANLIVTNFDASGAQTGSGLDLWVDGGSTLTGNFTNGSFSNSNQNGVLVDATDGSIVNLLFTDVTADEQAAAGNVVLSADGGSTLISEWQGGSIIDGLANGVTLTASGLDSLLSATFRDVAITGHTDSGLVANISGAGTIGAILFDGVDLSDNGDDAFRFDVSDAASLIALTETDSINDFSNSGSNAFQGTVTGAGSNATVLIENASATGSGEEGALFLADLGGQLNFTYIDGNLSGSGFDGLSTTTDNGSQTNITLQNVLLNFNGQDAFAPSGNGILAVADNGSVLNMNLDMVGTSLNAGRGLSFSADNNSIIEINPDGGQIFAFGNAEEGLAFDVNGGSYFALHAIDSSFIQNGSDGNFSGVLGNVAGPDSLAAVTFEDSFVDSNTLNGFEFNVSGGAQFIGELISTSASSNAASGVSLTANDANTIAALLLEGDNIVSGNSDHGLIVDANGIDLLAVRASGQFNSNVLGHGVSITSNNVGTTAIEVGGTPGSSASGNGLNGVDLQLTDTVLDTINVTTLTQNTDVAPLLVGPMTIAGNAGHGLNIEMLNTDLNGGLITGVTSTGNGGDGIRIVNPAAQTGQSLSLDVVGNNVNQNVGQGILLDLNGYDEVDLNILENSVANNGGAGIEVNIVNAAPVAPGANQITISDNQVLNSNGEGVVVTLDNLGLDTFTAEGNTIITTAANGFLLSATDSPINTITFNENSISTAMMGDGLRIELNSSGSQLLNITNNVIGGASDDGISIVLDDSPIDVVNITGNQIGFFVDDGGFGSGLDDTAPVIRLGFNDNTLPPNDDSSTGLVPIGFDIDFLGVVFDQLYVNNNGNVTFDTPLFTFTPFDLIANNVAIIAPFFADVDTRFHGDPVTYGTGTVGGQAAFGVNWLNVDYFASSPAHGEQLNSFQLVLVDRSDIAPGDFDIEFNYGQITWETGSASGGVGGLGGSSARAGFSNGLDFNFELNGSASNGAFLDSGPSETSLVQNSFNSQFDGRYVFFARSGGIGGGSPLSNTGNGLRIELNNNSDIGDLIIETNVINQSGANGIEIVANGSTLPGAGSTFSISDNTISNTATGDGIRMVSLDTNGTPFEVTMAGNTITNTVAGNGINLLLNDDVGAATANIANNIISGSGDRGIRLEGRENVVIDANLDGNTVTDSGNFGLHVVTRNNATLNLNVGQDGSITEANMFDESTNAGIAVSALNNSTTNLLINNTQVTNTRAGDNIAFGGDGLVLIATDNAVVNTLQVANSAFDDNAGTGIRIDSRQDSGIGPINLENFSASGNGGDGITIIRESSMPLGAVLISNGIISDNLGDGLDITASLGNGADVYTIQDSDISDNGGFGISLDARYGADIVADIINNTIDNNDLSGVSLTRFLIDPMVENPNITANFIDNSISFNGGHGVDVQATHTLQFDGNTIDGNALNGINLAVAALDPLATINIANGSVSNNGFGGAGHSGIRIGSNEMVVAITNNDIIGNGNFATGNGNGIEVANGGTTSIIGNTISNNADNGIAIHNGTHVINDNFISMNGIVVANPADTTGDGIQLHSDETGNLTVTADNNQIRDNRGRGVNLLVQGSTLADVTITNSTIQGNNLEGVYVYHTTSLLRTIDQAANDLTGSTDTNYTATPELVFNFHGNTVRANGLGTGATGTGLAIRVGTSGALTGPGAWEDNGGYVSDGLGFTAGNLTGRGGVLASITDNLFVANPGADVLIESINTVAGPLPATVGTWDGGTYVITEYTQDPLARLDINFANNTGDELDVVRAGASFSNAEGEFKSRTTGAATPGPFDSATRLRNAQRLASRDGIYAAPVMNTIGGAGDSDDFLYSGVGGSTFRATLDSFISNAFSGGDTFATTVQLGAGGVGELDFGYDLLP